MHQQILHTSKIYWAGGLFDHKELLGNLQLAQAIEARSEGRYNVHLSQNLVHPSQADGISIRNANLKALFACDAMVANFDGTDLDSGTVVEFCAAKSLDIPTVLLRTDFRHTGDSQSVPWNLMCAGWPRTEILWLNAMQTYQKFLLGAPQTANGIQAWLNSIAADIIDSLDRVCALPPWLKAEDRPEHYRRIAQSIGSHFDKQVYPDAP